MKKFFSRMWNAIRNASKIKIAIWSVVVVAVLGGGYALTHRSPATSTLIPVTLGDITETVSVTGNTTPTSSVSLGFGNSGIISNIYSAVGQNVSAGQELATLDTGDLTAQLKETEANVDSEQAKLAGLEAGAQPEDIAVSQAELAG